MTKHIVEKPCRFSESQMWDVQRSYYHEAGVSAWTGDVPFYITSNPFIAYCYAKIMLRFMQEWQQQHPEASDQPFYVIELGTGAGQFSFYMLKAFVAMCETLKMDSSRLRYVMTDFTQSNIDFWNEHPALKPYLDQGILDFAIYDMEQDGTISLQKSGKVLKPGSLSKPITVIANYLFDSIKTDIFTAKKDKIYESLITLSTDQSNLKDDKPKNWEKVKIGYETNEIDGNYYNDPVLDAVLSEYAGKLNDTHFLFPISSLTGLQRLAKLADNKLLLITSDKGYSRLDELDDLEYPELDFHGSFSVMVNYDAIARFFKQCAGDYYMQVMRGGILSGIFACDMQLDSMPEMNLAIQDSFEGLSPADYFNYYELSSKDYSRCNFETLVSLLSVSRWDPYIFEEIYDRLNETLEDADEVLLDFLLENLSKVADNYYHIPESTDILFNIGLLLHELEQYEDALKYYEMSRRYFEEEYELVYNIAYCQYHVNDHAAAKKGFLRALELNPKSKDSKEWLAKL